MIVRIDLKRLKTEKTLIRLGLPCMSGPFLLATSVQNFRIFTKLHIFPANNCSGHVYVLF